MTSDSKYQQVQSHDDLEDPPVLVARPMEVVQQERADAIAAASCWNQTRCAGCVGATAGCFTGGMLLSIVCATGCLYCASTQEGVGGDISRACGTFGVQANVMVRDFDEEHRIVDKSKRVVATSWSKAKSLNEEHDIVQKSKACIVSAVKASMSFSQKHNIVENTSSGVQQIVSVVAKEVFSSTVDTVDSRSAEDSDPERSSDQLESSNSKH